jgi:hypothetical protein
MSMKCVLIKIKFDIDINILKYFLKPKYFIVTGSAQQRRAQICLILHSLRPYHNHFIVI